MRINIPRLLLIAAAIAYVVVFDWTYRIVIVPLFGYSGEVDDPAPILYRSCGWALAILPALWMPIAVKRPSQIVYWFLYLLVLVPSFIVPFYTRNKDVDSLLLNCSAIFVSFALLGLIYRVPVLAIKRLRLSPQLFWGLIAAATIAVFVAFVASFGLSFRLVSLLQVYDVRAEFSQALTGGGIMGYLVPWQANAINPLFMAYGISRHKRLPLAIGVIGQLFIYSFTGFRSVFLSLALMLLLTALMSKRGRSFGLSATWGLSGAIVLTVAAYRILQNNLIVGLVLNRSIALPGLLTGYYFEFFSRNPQAQLGHSILSRFGGYPYHQEPPSLIGTAYFNDPSTYSNAHVWADAFCNFGIPGIFAFTAALGLVLWLIDSLARGRDLRLVTLLLSAPALTLSNVGLLTSMLTGGIGLVMVIVYLLPPAAQPLRSGVPEIPPEGRPAFEGA